MRAVQAVESGRRSGPFWSLGWVRFAAPLLRVSWSAPSCSQVPDSGGAATTSGLGEADRIPADARTGPAGAPDTGGGRATREAGAPDTALGLLPAVEVGLLDELQAAQAEYLRGQIADDQRRSRDAARLLLSTARRLEPLNAPLARETHLEALTAAMYVGDLFMPGGAREAAEAARAAPPAPDPPRPVDVVLDAFALLLTEGYEAAAPALSQALELLLGLTPAPAKPAAGAFSPAGKASMTIAMERCDWESLHTLTAGQAQVARDVSALVQLRSATMGLAAAHIMRGELSAAARLAEEEHLLAEATGTPPVATTAMLLAAWQGREQETLELIQATVREGTARHQGYVVDLASCARGT